MNIYLVSFVCHPFNFLPSYSLYENMPLKYTEDYTVYRKIHNR